VSDLPQLQYGTCSLCAGYLRQQTHTWNMKHLLLFNVNMSTVIAQTHLNVTLHVHCLSSYD